MAAGELSEEPMDIGQPKRIIEIEPTTLPVPGQVEPEPEHRPEHEPAPVAPEPRRS